MAVRICQVELRLHWDCATVWKIRGAATIVLSMLKPVVDLHDLTGQPRILPD